MIESKSIKQAAALLEKEATTTSELTGPISSTLLSALAGAGVGAGVGASTGREGDTGPMALGGGIAGGGLGLLSNLLGGPLGALITKSKSDKEMREAGESSAADYLVPGHGVYGLLKRLGHSQNKYD